MGLWSSRFCVNANTANLCVGDYELWFVVRTRGGPYVEARKDFRVRAPSCRDPSPDDVQAIEVEEGNAVGFDKCHEVSASMIAQGNERARANRASGWVAGSPEWEARVNKTASDDQSRKLSATPHLALELEARLAKVRRRRELMEKDRDSGDLDHDEMPDDDYDDWDDL
eukprot:g12381.t1